MNNDNLKQNNSPESLENTTPQIHVNEYGATVDRAVVVEEADRTVLLAGDEAVVITREKTFDVPPKNRERKVYAGMWGRTELITVGVALLTFLTTVLLFVFLVLPEQKELDEYRARRDDLEQQLTTARQRYGSITSTEAHVSELIASVNDFETRFLPAEMVGKTALYQRLNGLLSAYGLVNTSGPDYAPLEILDTGRGEQSGEQNGKSKFASVFPGVYVTMTVDGPYHNLRRFIRDLESSDQFIVVTAVELEPSENKETQQPNSPANPSQIAASNQARETYQRPNEAQFYQNAQQMPPQTEPQAERSDRGVTRGQTVSLRLEMAAYFKRENFQPAAVPVSDAR